MGLYPQPIERDRSFPLPIGITPIMTFSNLILAYYPKLSIQEIDPSPPQTIILESPYYSVLLSSLIAKIPDCVRSLSNKSISK
jgi:hypothetical protein